MIVNELLKVSDHSAMSSDWHGGVNAAHWCRSSVSTTDQPSFQVRRSIYMTASLHSTSLCSGKARLWDPPLPFATVQDDPDAARASELP